jgi:hypothetical protein
MVKSINYYLFQKLKLIGNSEFNHFSRVGLNSSSTSEVQYVKYLTEMGGKLWS